MNRRTAIGAIVSVVGGLFGFGSTKPKDIVKTWRLRNGELELVRFADLRDGDVFTTENIPDVFIRVVGSPYLQDGVWCVQFHEDGRQFRSFS